MSPQAALRILLERIQDIRSDVRGTIAITFAIASVPIILASGYAIDYSRAARLKTTLDAYADAAALNAVSKASMSACFGSSCDSAVQTAAVAFFNAQVTNSANPLKVGSVSSVTALVVDTASTNNRKATITYTASIPTAFLGIMGINNLAVSNSGNPSVAQSAVPTYMDFYMLLDNTPSMGIGATATDVATMVANTPDQCGFACHTTSDPANNYYAIAKAHGVTMRIDVVAQAVAQLTSTATSMEVVSNQFRMAIYDFGADASSVALNQVFALSSSMSAAQTAASGIDLMTIPYQNYNNDQQTDFDGVLSAMNTAIPTPGAGNGTNPAYPQKWLFFVTDGVADYNYPSTCTQSSLDSGLGGRCMEPLTVANCTTMKNRGVNIAVLYTTYQQLPTNAWYMQYIDPFNQGPWGPSPNSQIAQNLQACATPGYYTEVSPTQGISTAINTLFQKAVSNARLTQ